MLLCVFKFKTMHFWTECEAGVALSPDVGHGIGQGLSNAHCAFINVQVSGLKTYAI